MCVTLYFIASMYMCMFICLFVFNQNTAYSFLLWQAPIKLCAILDVICVYCTCPCCLRVYFHWLCCFNCTAGESVPEKGQHCCVKHSICWNPLRWWSSVFHPLLCSLIFLGPVHEMRYEKQAQWARSWEGCTEIFFFLTITLYRTTLSITNVTWRCPAQRLM